LKRALASAQIPSRLELIGLSYDNNKRPDGMALIPWSNGQILSWDATCSATLPPSYIAISSKNCGKVAAKPAVRKCWIYKEIIEKRKSDICSICSGNVGSYMQGRSQIY
jgi:hypothetical protein